MNNSSYFEKVIDFNKRAGVKLNNNIYPTIFEDDSQTIEFALKLIREEIKELEQAVVDKNIIEVADGIADSIYVLLGMSARIGINMDQVFNEVHENNMSKFCKTEEEAKLSVEYYKQNIEKLKYDTPTYRKSGDLWIVYNESTKKILKSIEWKPVDLSFIL